jgi:hypothetical protein
MDKLLDFGNMLGLVKNLWYPLLYAIVCHKNITVAEVMNQTTLNIGFMRVLQGVRWERWLHLVE